MRRLADRHPVSLFLLFTFVSSWTLWIASGVTSRTGAFPPDARWLAAQIGVFAPGLSALLVGSLARPEVRRPGTRILFGLYAPAVLLGAAFATRGFSDLRRVEAPWTFLAILLGVAALVLLGRGRNRIERWPLGQARGPAVARWTLGAVLVPVTVLAVGFLLSHAGEVPRAIVPAAPFRALTALGVLEALGFNLVFGGPLGEELGWRGFLLPKLLSSRSPFGASLVVGFWWALWHAPIDVVQGFVVSGLGGVLARQVWVLPLAVLFTWVTVRAGGSLLPAIGFHTVINAFPDFALAAPARYEAAVGAFFVVGLVLAVTVVAFDPVMLRSPNREEAQTPRLPERPID